MSKMVCCGVAALVLIPLAIASSQSSATDEAKSPSTADSGMALTRGVKGQVLTSTEMPAVRLTFDKAFKYVGGQTFILYDVARAEQHFFADADEQGRIKRMYWVQFEGYLPGNTESYRYKVTKTVKIGGLEFIADSFSRNIKDNPGSPESDGNRARAFLQKKGYRMAGDDVLSQRLVHLIDEQKRNELMIVYTEDLSPRKLTAKDLGPEGRAAAQWDDLTKGLLERAVKGMEISRAGHHPEARP